MRPALETADVTIEFDADEVSGCAGCNLYSGSYSARKDGTFSVDNVAWTEMACLEPGVMKQEQQFLNTLLQAKSYDVSDDTLTIGGDGGSLVFAPQ